jgi:hypothetical protein
MKNTNQHQAVNKPHAGMGAQIWLKNKHRDPYPDTNFPELS